MDVFTLFYRLILRPLAHKRLRTTLTVLAVSLGVAALHDGRVESVKGAAEVPARR
jgi:hypothetical protein